MLPGNAFGTIPFQFTVKSVFIPSDSLYFSFVKYAISHLCFQLFSALDTKFQAGRKDII